MNKKKEVSLVESERRQEWEKREKEALARLNKLRKARGLEPLDKLDDDDDDLPKDDDEKDPEKIHRIMQEEAAHILADYIRQQRPVTAQAR